MNNGVTAWSFSRWALYKDCPYKYVEEVVNKNKPPFQANPATIRGETIHKKAQHYLLGDIPNIPKDLVVFSDEFKQIRRLQAEPEIDLSVDATWKPSHAKDWDNVWLRANIDARITDGECSTIIDFKTGKKYETSKEQYEIYAVTEMCHSPEAKQVDVELWYLDHEEENVVSDVFHRKDFTKLKRKWAKNVKPLFTTTEAEPTPCFRCRYCHLASNKGGPCKYNSRGE